MTAEILSIERMNDFANAVRAKAEQRAKIPTYFLDHALEAKRRRALEILGDRWLLHPSHAPLKGDYNGWPTK
jgi:hypothetical protein